MQTKNIYIVEDDNDDFIFIQEALKSIAPGVPFKRFESAERLFDCIISEEAPPALFIIDYNLPLQTGIQVLKRLNGMNNFRDVPKVFYSNSNFRQHKVDALSGGAAAYFTKSVNMDDIKQDVLEMLLYSNPTVL
jgi:CheY-like chemotaxis protein